jgi:hypothetical protein
MKTVKAAFMKSLPVMAGYIVSITPHEYKYWYL